MSILVQDKKVIGASVNKKSVAKILCDNDVVWQKNNGTVSVYSGGTNLDGAFKNTYQMGSIMFSTAATGRPVNLEYNDMSYQYADIIAPYIKISSLVEVFEWEIGAFDIPIDLTEWKRIIIDVDRAANKTVSVYTQRCYCQVLDYISPALSVNSGTLIPESELPQTIQIDVSDIVGMKWIRLLGIGIDVAKITLDRQEV